MVVVLTKELKLVHNALYNLLQDLEKRPIVITRIYENYEKKNDYKE